MHRSTALGLLLAALAAGCRSGPVREPLPDWVHAPGRYVAAKAGTEYFLGIGRPCQTRVLAARSAAEAAHANIGRYLGEAFAAKWFSSADAAPLPGPQSVVAVVEEFVCQTLSTGAALPPKPLETHVESVRGRYVGRAVRMYRAYHLSGLTRSELAALARAAARRAAEEIKAEPDEARQASLRKLEVMLRTLPAKDLEF